MVENVTIQNGDMVSLAKIVSHNSKELSNSIDGVRSGVQAVFNEIDKDVTCLFKKQKSTTKNVNKLAIAVIFLEGAVLLQHFRLNKLEKKIKALEDQKVEDDFFFKDEDEDDSLK